MIDSWNTWLVCIGGTLQPLLHPRIATGQTLDPDAQDDSIRIQLILA